ncbi:LOW QUALITY PROTEIN: hypothetical protein BRADI_3g38881v3 [Brachypodium distachyon]|uniref:Dirigent protein n=1 Tax=Brachypodium distachyon TaxID=15368 RepID=A0A2K2D234_BRADI|nr:LOW QUALITY PROTEIN: hypothetical protein BRADI_3g38881v3 [Brachypodium distachyon]
MALGRLIITLLAALVPPLLLLMAAAAVDTHRLHLYMHDSTTGPNPSAMAVLNGTGPAAQGSRGAGRFGRTVVMDDPLTEGPGPASTALGRVLRGGNHGLGDGGPAMMLSMNLVLTAGIYNGSTLAVMGRNAVLAPVRELSVVGGAGRFRMATGYVLVKTGSWAPAGGDAVLQLDVFVYA